jgi:hypothetical protein
MRAWEVPMKTSPGLPAGVAIDHISSSRMLPGVMSCQLRPPSYDRASDPRPRALPACELLIDPA